MSSVPTRAAETRAGPEMPLLVALGAALGLSPFASGLYSSSLWVPAGLALLGLLTAALIAVPVRPSRPAIVAGGALLALALLSFLSALWTDSIHQAAIAGNRLLLYTACLALFVVLVRSDRAAVVTFAAVAAGALVVAGWVLIAMLRGDGTVFVGARLHEPLGYVNGQSTFFLLAFWPCLALSERCRPREERGSAAVPGLGLAAAALFAGLVVLGQSRGALLAAALSVGLVVVLLPGRLRRVVALLVVAACLGPAMPALLDVHNARAGDHAMRAGAAALGLACVAAGVIWGMLVALEQRARDSGLRLRRVVPIAVTALALITAAVGIASAGAIASVAERQYTAFVALDTEPSGATQSRLASGAGNRYDYWRIAVQAWRDRPLGGVGAGGYDETYFSRRATIEDVRQPHSLPLQVLAELGLAGMLLFAAGSAAIAMRAWRRARQAGRAPVVVAAVGVLTAWFVHASVDWMHLLPGLTAVALLGAAVLLRPPDDPEARARDARPARAAAFDDARSRTARVAPAIAVGLAIAIAALSLSRQGLTELYVGRAQDALARQPQQALGDANRALRLDAEAIPAYYAKAAALARFGEAGPARTVLLDAARREPRNFVTWVLLGDLAVRVGDLRAAADAYRRASRLNPRDRTLAQLAEEPRRAHERGRGR